MSKLVHGSTVGACESLHIVWLQIPNEAAVSATSNIPQNGIGNCLGMYITVSTFGVPAL